MENLYELNPFAGVICKICQCPIALKNTLFDDIHQHERKNVHHAHISSPEERKIFCASLQQKIHDIGKSFAKIRNNKDALKEEYSKYLCFPAKTFYECSECEKSVFDKRTHKRGRHFRHCGTSKLGYMVKNWTRKNPVIVPENIDINDKSVFLGMFPLYDETPQLTCDDINETSANNSTNRVSLEPPASPSQAALDQILIQQNARYNVDVTTLTVQLVDQAVEPDLWMDRVGYDKHLHGLIKVDLFQLSTCSPNEEEVAVSRVAKRVALVSKKAIAYGKSIDRSNMVLFVVKRIDFRPTPRPFNPNLGSDTWDRYVQVIQKVMIIITRIESEICNHDKRRYVLTREQRTLLTRIIRDEDDVESDEIYVKMLLSLLRQPFEDNSYESALLSSLAIMSIQKDGSFRSPNETTQLYAALIAIYRSLILYSGKHFPLQVSLDGGNGSGFIGKVRHLTESLMIHPESGSNPGPMSWILNSFSYAKAICRETVRPGMCYWDDDVLVFKNIHFSTTDLRLMASRYVADTKELIADLSFSEKESTSADLPSIPWNRIVDDVSDTSPGYSFLTEPKNKWIEKKQDFLFKKVRNDTELRKTWFDKEGNTIDENTLRNYGRKLDKLRESLLGLIHITSGQPARGTEITNLRFVNSLTPRNVCIDRGVVCIRTTYHKTMMQTGKGKNIYRYLPPCVGELVIYYLWLILPFYQTMHGAVNESTVKSIYLWSKDLSHAVDKSITSEDLWNSTKLSNVLVSVFLKYMGVEINLSMWRHIAVAISRRFLRQAYTDPSDEDQNDEDNDGSINDLDAFFDLQMAHSTAVANRVYAPLLNHSVDTATNIIDGYRRISFEWHSFLFPKIKPTNFQRNDVTDVYRTFVLRVRLRRLQLLAAMEPCSQLRLLLNNPGVDFRGNQKDTIQAIVRGDSFILQVAPTGIGKSLSFILPAFAAREGTSVVIVPLVSLQKDLVKRCKQLGLSAIIWDAYQFCVHSTIVFVTPESAVSQAFIQYVTTLMFSHKLDRIVVDECHTVLSGCEEFRPKLNAIRDIVRYTGVQVLMLTATLPPSKENLLFSTLGLPKIKVTVIRDPTTRRNVRYIVKSISNKTEEYISEVSSCMKTYICDGKCIIYCRCIRDGNTLSNALDLPFYYSGFGSSYDKEKLLNNFISSGTAIVATNALGLGIDIPDVRLVIHVGSPKTLDEFAQESGRAGRDGRDSVSMLLHVSKYEIECDMAEYINTGKCRRFSLDNTMDGTHRTMGCCDDESFCDLCLSRNDVIGKNGGNTAFASNNIGDESDSMDNGLDIDDKLLVHVCDEAVALSNGRKHASDIDTNPLPLKKQAIDSDSGRRIIAAENELRLEYRREKSQEQNEYILCTEMLEEIARSKCIFCTLKGTNVCRSECSLNKKAVSARCKSVSIGLRFPNYSACFIPGCYVPQAICNHWEENAWGFKTTNKPCQYKYVLLNTIYSLCIVEPKMEDELNRMVLASGSKDVKSYFIKAARWHGIQTTNLFVCFFQLLSKFKQNI